MQNTCNMFLKLLIYVFLVQLALSNHDIDVVYATESETCKILAFELDARLNEGKNLNGFIETGYAVDEVKPRRRYQYRLSELRLLESLENVCDRVLQYSLHKERKDSARFAKGMPQTFRTLHNLVDKGVKVDLGIPYELWDKPPIEITQMKTQCENLLERYEDVISNWYFNFQDTPLVTYLCKEITVKHNDRSLEDNMLEENIHHDLRFNKESKFKKDLISKSEF